MDRWRGSRRCARRSSIAATGCLPTSTATSSLRNRPPTSSAESRLDDGTTLRARKAYDHGEFLASTDERFRPVFLSNAPDGTLYVVDMYRGIIEHRISVTEYLRDQILARKLEQPTGFGRIYRVVHDSTSRDSADPFARATGAARRGAVTSERLAARHGPAAARRARGAQRVPRLTRLASQRADWRTRLHALWTLDGIDAIQPATVTKALEDPYRDVRVSAIRLAERWLGEDGIRSKHRC